MSENIFWLFGTKWQVGYGLERVVENGKTEYLDYKDIIKILHPHIVWFYEEDDDYQGDFFCCGYDKNNNWYFIQGSFGSCSGCDWLQSLETIKEAKEFLNHFKKTVIVKTTKNEIIDYMMDTENNVDWSKDTLEKLVQKIKELNHS